MKDHPYVREISAIFDRHDRDRYRAHEEARPLLSQMSKDPKFLFEVLRWNLRVPNYLGEKRLLGEEIATEAKFALSINILPSLGDGSIDISAGNVHHHGYNLLTTVTIEGPGYYSLKFDKDYSIERTGTGADMVDAVDMKIVEHSQHVFQGIEFVDSFQPHVVFFPDEMSATIVLWSADALRTAPTLRTSRLLKPIKRPLVKAIRALGLADRAGLNVIVENNFSPRGDKLFVRHGWAREAHARNEFFLRNIFHFYQKVGFGEMDAFDHLNGRVDPLAHELIGKLAKGEPIDEMTYAVDRSGTADNFSCAEIVAATGYASGALH